MATSEGHDPLLADVSEMASLHLMEWCESNAPDPEVFRRVVEAAVLCYCEMRERREPVPSPN